jgi:ubiquinone biosynthesis accessory factor UbiJ
LDFLRIILQPVASLLNRQIRAQTSARMLCESLNGISTAIRVRNSSLVAYLLIDSGQVSVAGEYTLEPDVVITGTLLSLLQLAGSANEDLIRRGDLELTGDAHVATQLKKLLVLARPDAEEELSRLVGDVAAHGIGDVARGIGKWGRDARGILRQNISEYLQEESRALPSRYEVERFRGRVELLRDDVARLEARIRRLEPQQATSQSE